MEVHWVLLMGLVQDQGPVDVAPHHGEGPIRELPAWHGSTFNQLECFTPACPIANIFILTGNIGSWGQGKGRVGWGERPQEPKGKQGLGGGSGGRNRDIEGATIDETGAEKRTTVETTTTVAQVCGRRRGRKHTQVSSYRAGGRYRE